MSDVIDRSIVEMQFDNRQFESGIAQSLNSIQKLKDSLNFSKSLDAFETISRSIKSVSFDPMVTIWQTTLTRITNMAINAGQRITRALTIEPVFTGFQEYTTQIDAVQTILANTEKYGTTLNDVNKALDELNLYADKTIYNFTQMTSNIGRFTAAGVQLDPAVKSIEGMSNLAASSGATAEQASRAYYQMSQALAGLGLRLMDYNSLVNAGMGGQLFQEALKQTARDVKKTTEEYVKLHASGMSVEDISKKFGVSIDNVSKILSENYNKDVDEAIKKQGSFRESLSQGWATADILQRTFAKFSSTGMVEYLHMVTGASTLALEELQKIGQQTSFDSKEFNEYAKSIENVTEAQLEEIKVNLKQAQTAEDAATKVKTFAQLKDTVKEAVQSGWTQTWEYIIGDFEQAKEFFTRISDYLGNIIGKYSDWRNKIVGDWSVGGGRTAVINGLWNIVKIIEKFIIPLKNAWDNVFPDINVAAVLISISRAFETLTERLIPNEKVVSRIQTVYEKIFNVFEALRVAIGNLIHLAPKLENALSSSIFAGVFNIFENKSYASYRGGLIGHLQKLYGVISDISDKEITIPGMESEGKSKLSDYKPYQRMLESLANFWSTAQDVNMSKLINNSSDIEKLNDALMKMAFGIEDGNKIVSKFSTTKREDFLKYLQEEYGIELEIAEDIYRLVDKLNGVETDIIRLLELSPMKELLIGDQPGTIREVLAKFIGDILGTDMYSVLDAWDKVDRKLNEGLRRLAYAFNDTISVLKTLDMLLGAMVYLTVIETSNRVIKPLYLFVMQYFAPAMQKMYEAVKYYALPALDGIIASVLILLKLGLETIFDNFTNIIDNLMPKIKIFGAVLAIISNIIANAFYKALEKLSKVDPSTVFNDIGKAIKDWITSIDTTFKNWAGFSIKDVIDGVLGDLKWVLQKIDTAFKITERFNDLTRKIRMLISLWRILLKNEVIDVSKYVSAFENLFGKFSDSKLAHAIYRFGKILNGAYLVLSTVSEQFKILIDNPGNKTLAERLRSFFNRIYDSFVQALRLNGVSESVIKVCNLIYYVLRDVFDGIVSIITTLADKLTYSTIGLKTSFDLMIEMLTSFVEAHPLVVKSIGTALLVLAFASILLIVVAHIITTGDTIGEAIKKLGTFLFPGNIFSRIALTLQDISDAADDISQAFKVMEVVSVAMSIVLLAGTLYLLATLDYDKLIQVTGVMLAVMIGLTAFLGFVSLFIYDYDLMAISASVLSFAAIVAAFAAFVLIAGEIEKNGGNIWKALGFIGLLLAEIGLIMLGMTFITTVMGKHFGDKVASLARMVIIGDSIKVMAQTLMNLAPVIYLVSKLDTGAFIKAMIAVAIIFGGMSLWSWAASKANTGNIIDAAIESVALATSMLVLVGALKLLVWTLEDADPMAIVFAIAYITLTMALMAAITAIAGFSDWKSLLVVPFILMTLSITIISTTAALSILAIAAEKCKTGLIIGAVAMGALLLILQAFVGIFALLGVLAEAGVGVIPLVAVAGGLLLIGMTALELGASLIMAGISALMFVRAIERLWEVCKEIGKPLAALFTAGSEALSEGYDKATEFTSKSFVEHISSFLARIYDLVNKFVDNLIKILGYLLPTLRKIVNELFPMMDEFFELISTSLSNYLPKWIGYIANFFTALITEINEFGPPLVEAITQLVKWVLDIIVPWLNENMPGWLEKLTPVAKAIIDFVVNLIADLLVALDSRAEDIATSILGIINKILNAMTEVVDETTGQTRIEAIFDKLYIVLDKAITEFLPKIVELLLKLLGTIASVIVSTIMIIVATVDVILENIVDYIGDHFADHVNHLADILLENKDPILASIERLFKVIGAYVIDGIGMLFGNRTSTDPETLNGALNEGIMGTWKFITGILTIFVIGTLLLLKYMGVGFLPALIGGVAVKLELAKTFFKGTFETFLNGVRNVLGFNKDNSTRAGVGIHNIGYSIIKGLISGIKGAWNLLFGESGTSKSIGRTLLSDVKDILTIDEFTTIGENIVNGIINGINNLKDSLKDTVTSVFGPGTGVLAWIKTALDESSPSKATQEMGIFVDKGFETGLRKEQPAMMKTVDEVFGDDTGVMEGIRVAVGTHSESWKTKEMGEDTDAGYESGIEEGEPGMIDKVKEAFGKVIDTIKDTFSSSEDGSNPLSSLLEKFISGWDPDKSLTENLKDKFVNLFIGEGGIFGEGGLFSGLFDGITGENGIFGENGLFSGILDDFTGLFTSPDGTGLFDNLFSDIGDIKWLSDMNYDDIFSNSLGETLGDGKLNTSVSKANHQITSTGANMMNDMYNSGQYWYDQNALTNADIVNAIATVVQRLDNIDENMPKEVVLDTGAMVGNLSPEMNKALGKMLRQKGRRV